MEFVSLIFAVAGSGKTQKIFNHLYTDFDNLIVLGNVETKQPTGSVRSGVLKPHRRDTSLDANLIHRYKVPVDSYSQDKSLWQAMQYNSERLVRNREFTFWAFLKQQPMPKPPHWLLFQTVWRGDADGFDPVFRTEPLVVRAVIEHLRSRPSGYNDMPKRLLFDSQDDSSFFGKAAEYYLAWVSHFAHDDSCPNTSSSLLPDY